MFECLITRSAARAVTAFSRLNEPDREKGNYDLCIEEFEELIQTEEETDDSLEAEALSKAVECFVNGLKETNRMIFVRRFWYLDDYRSLAEKTGMNETAVRKRVSRMKADLMEYLKKKGMMINEKNNTN